MAHANPWNLVSTVLLVTGALVFGEALHQSVVTGEVPLFSRSILLALGLGTVLIALGYRVRVPAENLQERSSSDAAADSTDAAATSADGTAADSEYDPRMSPLGNTPSDARDRPFGEDARGEARRSDDEHSDERGSADGNATNSEAARESSASSGRANGDRTSE